jgi:hypothetical protein
MIPQILIVFFLQSNQYWKIYISKGKNIELKTLKWVSGGVFFGDGFHFFDFIDDLNSISNYH